MSSHRVGGLVGGVGSSFRESVKKTENISKNKPGLMGKRKRDLKQKKL